MTYVIDLDRDGMTEGEFLEWIDENIYQTLDVGIGDGHLDYDPVIDLED